MSLRRFPLVATAATLAVLLLGASLRYPGFCSVAVFTHLFDDNAFLGVSAVGETFVILAGGIDLSVGSVIGLTSILSAVLVERQGLSPFVVIPLVLALGSTLGLAMGVLIRLFSLPPFLVTLAGMFLARGAAFIISLDSIALQHPFYARASAIPLLNAGIFLAAIALGSWAAGHTRFGRAVYALGGNAGSASLMGLPVARTQILVYTASGFCSALAGIIYTLYTSSGNASAATGLELDAIAAVVIGGTILTGGAGHVLGTMLGVLILGAIQTAITFEGTLSSWWTRIAVGALLFAFVVLQRLINAGSRTTEAKAGNKPIAIAIG